MDRLVEALVNFLEIFVLGGLAVVVFWYFIVLLYPVKKALVTYFIRIRNDLVGEAEPRAFNRAVLIALILGLIYYMGVVTNEVSYWILDPLHLHVIEEVYADSVDMQDPCKESPNRSDADSGNKKDPRNELPNGPDATRTWIQSRGCKGLRCEEIVLPFTKFGHERNEDLYWKYQRQMAHWRHSFPDEIESTLSVPVKQIRIMRGSATIALLFILGSSLKLLLSLSSVLLEYFAFVVTKGLCRVGLLLGISRKRIVRFSRWALQRVFRYYEIFVDAKLGQWREDYPGRSPEGRISPTYLRSTGPSNVPTVPLARSFDESSSILRDYTKCMVSVTIRRMLFPSFLILLISWIMFIVSMNSFILAEWEYHMIVRAALLSTGGYFNL